ncbi:hypothetical protein BGZ60DRAFT_516754 [Tricladium varicosporioides]|nr:hypothetical protein BGZ60DRAFT_516754 [Hymenoscyphus varicosporioides]
MPQIWGKPTRKLTKRSNARRTCCLRTASPSRSHNSFNDIEAFKVPSHQHSEFHALLIYWEEDDIGLEPQVRLLSRVFRDIYHFTTILVLSLPSQHCHLALHAQLHDFLRAHSGPKNVLVVYYSGHGELDEDGRLIWTAYQRPKAPDVPIPELVWTKQQTPLEQSLSPVLLILDCCSSGGSIPYRPSITNGSPLSHKIQDGPTEILAACGFETETPGKGPESFFNILIEELCSPSARNRFSILDLHRRMVRRSLLRRGESRTPVYVRIGGSPNRPGITLRILNAREEGWRNAKAVIKELLEEFQEKEYEELRVGQGNLVDVGVQTDGGADAELLESTQMVGLMQRYRLSRKTRMFRWVLGGVS